jgi:hypothetical protein
MPDTIDVTDLIGPPRKVKISDALTLLFPMDLPVETYLTILHLQDRPEELEDQSVVQSLRDDVLELLQVHQPGMTRLPPAVSIPVLIQLIGRVYRAEPDPPPPAAKPRAKKAASRGSTTTRPRRPSTSSS